MYVMIISLATETLNVNGFRAICLNRDTMDENVDSLTFIKFGTDPGLQIVADCWLAQFRPFEQQRTDQE